MKKLSMMLAVLSLSIASPAFAAFSPSSPPPEWVGTQDAWAKLVNQGTRTGAAAAKLVKGADPKCLAAVFVKMLVNAQVSISLDTSDHGLPKNVRPDKASKLTARAQQERDDSCSGPTNSSGATVEAMARYVEEHQDYDVSEMRSELARLYTWAKPSAVRGESWVEYLIKAGFLVHSAGARVAVAAGSILPIVDPGLFSRKANPADGI